MDDTLQLAGHQVSYLVMEQAWRFARGDERHWSLRLRTAAARARADRAYPCIAGEYMEEP